MGFEYGRIKLDKYWKKITKETPYYYAAVMLHRALKIDWFNHHWQKYKDSSLPEVRKGFKSLVDAFIKKLGRTAASVIKAEVSVKPCKVPEDVSKRRELFNKLHIESDDESDPFTDALRLSPLYAWIPRYQESDRGLCLSMICG